MRIPPPGGGILNLKGNRNEKKTRERQSWALGLGFGRTYLFLFSFTIFRRALFISLRFFFSSSETDRSSRRA